jgi:hypothetical protein
MCNLILTKRSHHVSLIKQKNSNTLLSISLLPPPIDYVNSNLEKSGLTNTQELQKIPAITMSQHRQDPVIKQAHIKGEQAKQE